MLIRKRNGGKCGDGFRIPYGKVLLPLNLILLAAVMFGFSGQTWIRFVLWSGLGALLYFAYGMKNSLLNKES